MSRERFVSDPPFTGHPSASSPPSHAAYFAPHLISVKIRRLPECIPPRYFNERSALHTPPHRRLRCQRSDDSIKALTAFYPSAPCADSTFRRCYLHSALEGSQRANEDARAALNSSARTNGPKDRVIINKHSCSIGGF